MLLFCQFSVLLNVLACFGLILCWNVASMFCKWFCRTWQVRFPWQRCSVLGKNLHWSTTLPFFFLLCFQKSCKKWYMYIFESKYWGIILIALFLFVDLKLELFFFLQIIAQHFHFFFSMYLEKKQALSSNCFWSCSPLRCFCNAALHISNDCFNTIVPFSIRFH